MLDDILHREVTRREFLKLVGIAAIGAFGVSRFLSGLTPGNHTIHLPTSRQHTTRTGFGSRKFGE